MAGGDSQCPIAPSFEHRLLKFRLMRPLQLQAFATHMLTFFEGHLGPRNFILKVQFQLQLTLISSRAIRLTEQES